MKGLSITHYLLKFLHYIKSSLDSTIPTGVVAAFIDLSKAINRVDHNLLIQDLYEMNCPSWLLRIVFSFLSDRNLIVHYKSGHSSKKSLPGASPQRELARGDLLHCIV